MQPLGAWMIVTPCLRAASRTAFIRGAISTARRTALRQWCESHISQTMIAVWTACHVSGTSLALNPAASATRERLWTVILASSAAGAGETTAVTTARAANTERMAGSPGEDSDTVAAWQARFQRE